MGDTFLKFCYFILPTCDLDISKCSATFMIVAPGFLEEYLRILVYSPISTLLLATLNGDEKDDDSN